MTLYGYWRSSCSWRVRIALHLKGLPFENVPVHLVADGGQQNHADYLQKNPMGQVPLLVTEDGNLSQSLPIIEYLDALHPEPALLPTDPFVRAQTRALAEMINSGVQPIQNLAVLQYVVGELKGDKLGWGRHWIQRGLDRFEQAVRPTAGTFCVGDQVSLADLCLVPQLYNARRFGCDESGWSTMLRIETACMALDAFQAAHPDRQPDAPGV